MRTSILMMISFAIHTLLLLSLFHTHIAGNLAFFYRGLIYIMCTGLVQATILVVLRKRFMIPIHVIVSLTCVFISIHVVFFTLVPVTLDRSVSVFLLQHMSATGVVSTKKQLESILIDDFIGNGDAVGKRMIEQEQTGSIQKEADGWRITPRGVWLVNTYKLVGAVFGIRLVEGR